ncbi:MULTISPECIES: murein L,D-transpeptidase family protein [Paracoccus]|uniref:L,D-transpeptidase family protein n=1 Tax=Paracoccus litorisediminis TaxID=2006130 RepID=A0A844HJ77_9RHOB|nr:MULTISPECIES: L,D-transpeptidase family protein [Paracoccus]MBD9527909.1 L,D-transpeptidase family protein [Paracoccus sp. PAR01]MTH59926.1 L,D-transpeptidase family protein [Paracoccus litorisediminis]
MRRWLTGLIVVGLIAGLSACGPSKFKRYSGPPVTEVLVLKGERKMYLLSGNRALKAYNIGLGNEPIGHKQVEGDGKTPEGLYYIDRRNPDSKYHLSVGVSYPNVVDSANAASFGMRPGGDIFIHGQGPEGRVLSQRQRDWTAGCIAVRDDEVEDVYAMVRNGTPIRILP